jgi:uncharacterized protein (TIGR02284 family)
MKSSNTSPLVNLVQTLNDGVACYRTAINKVEHDDCKALFNEVIACREFALDYLQPYVAFANHTETAPSFGETLHQAYAQVETNTNADHDLSLIKQLERVEDETLKAMQYTALHGRNVLVQSVIRDLLPRMQACRERVFDLEKTLAA